MIVQEVLGQDGMTRAVLEAIQLNAITQLILVFIGFIFFIWFFSKLFSISKPHEYRHLVTDMYIAGVVRKLADEDKISLDDEYKKFKRWEKKQDLKRKDLDEAIEENLKEKVSAKADKEIDSIK